MKNKIVKGVSLACLISLIFSCNSKKDEAGAVAVDKEQIKKEIQAKEDQFAAAYNSGSRDSIGYFAEDAISFSQNKPPLLGKREIIDYLYALLDSSTKSHKISFETTEVFPSSDGNMVVEIGYYKVVDGMNNAVNTGNYMVMFEKRNGRYVCVRDMSASDMPLR
jgi:ketosteroid isomerase-like protein